MRSCGRLSSALVVPWLLGIGSSLPSRLPQRRRPCGHFPIARKIIYPLCAPMQPRPGYSPWCLAATFSEVPTQARIWPRSCGPCPSRTEALLWKHKAHIHPPPGGFAEQGELGEGASRIDQGDVGTPLGTPPERGADLQATPSRG